MELDPQETKNGARWLFTAGLGAILLSVFLQVVDFELTTSDAEIVKGEMLKELRTAQASVAGRATDGRQTSAFLYRQAAEEESEVKHIESAEEHGHSDGSHDDEDGHGDAEPAGDQAH